MEEHIFPDTPTSKLYTENAIRVATFLGGPLIAGYLIADNYRQLGEERHIQTTWLITILATVAIFIIVDGASHEVGDHHVGVLIGRFLGHLVAHVELHDGALERA